MEKIAYLKVGDFFCGHTLQTCASWGEAIGDPKNRNHIFIASGQVYYNL